MGPTWQWEDTLGPGEKDEQGTDREVISCALADWKPPWRPCVVCQLGKNGKLKSKTSLMWQICRSHFKSGFRTSDNRYNGKYVKNPASTASAEQWAHVPTLASVCVSTYASCAQQLR